MPEISYLEAIRQALWQEMKRDERVFLLGEDIGRYGGAFGLTHGMLDEFGGERVLETPISEAAIVATAIGAALLGMRPVAELMFMDFVLLSLDQLANQAAKMHFMFGGRATVPMVVRMPGGSGSGAASQHSQSLESLLMQTKQKVKCPKAITRFRSVLPRSNAPVAISRWLPIMSWL